MRPPRNPPTLAAPTTPMDDDFAAVEATGTPTWFAATGGVAVPLVRPAGLPTVGAVPMLSLDRDAARRTPTAQPAAMSQPINMSVRVASHQQQQQPAGHGTRGLSSMPPDALVDAFRATCEGRVAEAACTPQGKSLLQAALRTERPEVLEPVVAELCPHLRDVAVDAQGCHVLRTLVEACTAEQTEALMGAMHASVVLNMCTASQYTRRTLQSMFERREVDLTPIVRVLADNAGYLAATQQGCISLMRVFELCDAAQKADLVRELLPKLAALSMDAYANYMVQCAIEHSDRTTAAQYVVAYFTGNILTMSCNKFASNVLEAALRCCGEVPAVRRLFLDELVFNPAALKEVVSHEFGNFVVQSLIGVVSNPMEFKRVEDRLRPVLVGCPFAAKIEGKLKAKRQPQTNGSGSGAAHHAPHHHNQQQQPQPNQQQYNQHQNQHQHQQQQTHAQLRGAPHHAAASARVDPYAPILASAGPRHAPAPMMMAAAPAGATAEAPAVVAHAYSHRPYDRTPLSYVTRSAEQAALAAPQPHPAEYYRFPLSEERRAAAAAAGVAAAPLEAPVAPEDADCGPVYGPSPAARRHLQQQQRQQQAFRPPFDIAC